MWAGLSRSFLHTVGDAERWLVSSQWGGAPGPLLSARRVEDFWEEQRAPGPLHAWSPAGRGLPVLLEPASCPLPRHPPYPRGGGLYLWSPCRSFWKGPAAGQGWPSVCSGHANWERAAFLPRCFHLSSGLRARPSPHAGLGAGPRGRVMVSGWEAWAGGWGLDAFPHSEPVFCYARAGLRSVASLMVSLNGDPSFVEDRAAPGTPAGPAQPRAPPPWRPSLAPCPLALCCGKGGLGEGLPTQGPELAAGLVRWKGRARGAGSVGTGPLGRLRGPGLLGKMWVSFSLPWDALGDFETVRGAVGFRI